ncbi:hypothetical protein GCM10009838_37330 [Catenulispora subtropica]|uniref:DUF11 domain-containing protein n=1 Tax=Catenulispora subtropica TaxID=450798 RepID=A0ABN2RS90_9ACTN
MALAAVPSAVAVADAAGVSVAVHASGTAVHEGQRVSYAIEVHNGTGHAMLEAVVTQQLPPNLAFVAAFPAARREGRRLTWTLAVPAHGTTRITMTGAARRPHRLGSRLVTDQAAAHGGRRPQLATMVCVREDPAAGPLACATGRSTLRPDRMPHRLKGVAAGGTAAGAVGAWSLGVRVRRRRRSAQVSQR